jgi:Family of unknown function (DUF5343)
VAKKTSESNSPKFPYTTQPKALRRLLAEIPKRPKPPKMTMETLKAWDVSSNNNASTAINVLKKLGLLDSSGAPSALYVDFMKTGSGPGVLADRIRDIYRVLFENCHAPQNESDEELKKLFNIHSGGGEDAMRFQIQTFKALSEHANFGAAAVGGASSSSPKDGVGGGAGGPIDRGLPPIQVDLHIHLPENKTTRDYEAIIQDIAKYIYGRDFDKS